jgi:hypothetical protein
MSDSTSKRVTRHRRADASTYLKEEWGIDRSPRTLAKDAVLGGGPPMEYVGRFPMYPQDGLDEWAASMIGPRVNSTSERRQHAIESAAPAGA